MSLKPVETLKRVRSLRARVTQPAIAAKNGCVGSEKQGKFSEIFLTVMRHCGILRAAAARKARSSRSASVWRSIGSTRRSMVKLACAGTVLIFAPSPQ